jgi:hypothetical protein
MLGRSRLSEIEAEFNIQSAKIHRRRAPAAAEAAAASGERRRAETEWR